MSSVEVPGEREIRRHIDDFRASHLGRWRKAVVDVGGAGPDVDYACTNLTVQAEYDDAHVVEIVFRGVRELRFPRWLGFDSIAIEDIRDHQLEGVRYRVTEMEEGKGFRCLCRSVAFTKLLSADHESCAVVVWDAVAAS